MQMIYFQYLTLTLDQVKGKRPFQRFRRSFLQDQPTHNLSWKYTYEYCEIYLQRKQVFNILNYDILTFWQVLKVT